MGAGESQYRPVILVVDDREAMRYVYQRCLANKGYSVLLSQNAAEAIQIYDTTSTIDCLVVDHNLEKNGSNTALLEHNRNLRQLPVIIFSGNDAAVQTAKMYPNTHFVKKPDNATLYQLLADLFKHKSA